MADKEATVYIIDLGKSMGKKRHERNETDLDLATKYIWERISNTVFAGRKLAHIGVIGFRTDETNNPMPAEEYNNISVLLDPPQQVQMAEIRHLKSQFKANRTDEGDAISAVVLAVNMIEKHCKKLKYIRRIVLVTNARGYIDGDDNPKIAKRIEMNDIELTIVCVDYDDPSSGFKEEDKDPGKKFNEDILKGLASLCNGSVINMSKALSDMEIPSIKIIRAIASFKGQLTLGDTAKYDNATVSIDVERYPRVMVAKAISAKLTVEKSDFGGPMDLDVTQSTATAHEDGPDGSLAAVKRARAYVIDDPEAPGGKRDVEKEELERGYEYGRTAVNIGSSEENIVKLETDQGLQIVGFIDAQKFERFYEMTRTNYIVAARADERHAMALSSVVHGLLETNSFAIARLVKKPNDKPVILLLAPSVELGYECLVDSELPFAEDLRYFNFPPLDRVITVSGKKITEHRNLPSKELLKSMSDYIDAMDLSDFGRDEAGIPTEYAKMNETYSPLVSRVNQVVRHRAIYPDDPLPELYDLLTKYMEPPEKLLTESQKALQATIKAADVKKVPAKQKGRKRRRETDKPVSGLDIDALLGSSGKRQRTISADNAVPEFKQALAASDDMELVSEATRQMGGIIESFIRGSVGDSAYGKALEALRVMREELVDLEEPEMYNDFVMKLKKSILAGELGGERREMWWKIRTARLGLVDSSMSEVSKVTGEEAREFYKASS